MEQQLACAKFGMFGTEESGRISTCPFPRPAAGGARHRLNQIMRAHPQEASVELARCLSDRGQTRRSGQGNDLKRFEEFDECLALYRREAEPFNERRGLPGSAHEIVSSLFVVKGTRLAASNLVEDAAIGRSGHDLHEEFGIEHVTLQIERGDAESCALAPDNVV
ncbi:hypothetical protein JDN40_03750 [Rhodomicrobium vannielii ATCC 17100]|uniref:hypothetical protein n=1 Tax=Rhodomicrobium vannielii TaxID=1069 RepID=UPI001919C4E0|nr:hypothetical protein [Rhodomicrobium vannielii]MBJ7533220.1 hypothetical protein [Rhodomicrobium vannielii ATCC 17100]